MKVNFFSPVFDGVPADALSLFDVSQSRFAERRAVQDDDENERVNEETKQKVGEVKSVC